MQYRVAAVLEDAAVFDVRNAVAATKSGEARGDDDARTASHQHLQTACVRLVRRDCIAKIYVHVGSFMPVQVPSFFSLSLSLFCLFV